MNVLEKSKIETETHRDVVRQYIHQVIDLLLDRAKYHDVSKLMTPEVETFAEYTPKLKNTVFGSDEYNNQLKEMHVALEHHYAHNRHHPEHFPNGISGMTIVDVLEMLVDWKASSLRQNTGNALIDIKRNQERFGYSNDLADIFKNTIELFENI